MISSSVIILLSSSATSPRSSFVPLDAIETHTCTPGCEGRFICCVYSTANSLKWKIFCQKKKKRKKEKNIFFLTHHLRGALRKSLFSSSSHLKTFRKACYYQSIHFHFPLLPYFRNHVPEFSVPLILWLPGINICRNTRKAGLKLWHRCENSWK